MLPDNIPSFIKDLLPTPAALAPRARKVTTLPKNLHVQLSMHGRRVVALLMGTLPDKQTAELRALPPIPNPSPTYAEVIDFIAAHRADASPTNPE